MVSDPVGRSGAGGGDRRYAVDLRKGFASLSLRVQEVLRQDPLGGHLFCFWDPARRR